VTVEEINTISNQEIIKNDIKKIIGNYIGGVSENEYRINVEAASDCVYDEKGQFASIVVTAADFRQERKLLENSKFILPINISV
jgi:hypothetical protein